MLSVLEQQNKALNERCRILELVRGQSWHLLPHNTAQRNAAHSEISNVGPKHANTLP
jgi:hypothetical protein